MSKNHLPRLLAFFALIVCLSGPAVQAQTGEDIDPVNDLAGLLVPSSDPSSDGTTSGTLYVMPDQQDSVLAALNATPTGKDTYNATINGISVTFTAVLAVLPAIFIPPGDLICANSTVRVYKNARCLLTFPGFTTACIGLPGGSSARTTFNPIRTCRRGTAICVEVWQVTSMRTTYFGANCAPPITGVTTGNGFSC
jgi:hypothetical protein